MIGIDTNVMVYSVDAGESVKQAKARELIRHILESGEATIIPWQVAVEFLAILRKWQAAGKLSGVDVRIRFDAFLAVWVFAMPTMQTLRLGLDYFDRFSLSHWDSLMVAACRESGVTQLYSEDMQDGADYDGVVIVNPFV